MFKLGLQNLIDRVNEFYKLAYYQGTEEPTPHKKKYKSERAIVVQPRFKEPFFKNFDYAESEGVDGPAKHGPGTGLFRNMEKYKNVKDFLKKKRERNKDKYKADDSYIEDDVNLTKNKIAKRINYLRNLIKTAEDNNSIDFPIDEQIKSDPILGDSGTYSNSAQLGGLLDPYTQQQDVDGNQPMNIGPYEREHTEDATDLSLEQINELEQIDELKEILKSLKNKSLTPKDTELYGLPQGSNLWEESDILSDNPNYYGTTDSGNTLYDKK
jgi:hypothetical protein